MIGPWPDLHTARLYLHRLASGEPWVEGERVLEVDALSEWLVRQGLGPLVYHLSQRSFPALAIRLKGDAMSALAENSMHFDRLRRIQDGFRRADLPLVLVKGAALCELAYGGLGLRPMTDVDIWVGKGQMEDAFVILQELGFVAQGKQERPAHLQMLSQGEIQFLDLYGGLVELHWSPFPGWWVKRVAAPDDAGVWSRIELLPRRQTSGTSSSTLAGDSSVAKMTSGAPFYHLAPGDAVIQLAAHTAVNHQFGKEGVRGLMDIVLTARARPVEWQVVVERAQQWRLGVVVWLNLYLADQLIGLEEVQPILADLRPSRLRRRLLKELVSPEKVLAGTDHRASRARYLLLLLLVDRPLDMLRLIYRTLWPEAEWMEARYQRRQSRLGHLWNLVRHGQV